MRLLVVCDAYRAGGSFARTNQDEVEKCKSDLFTECVARTCRDVVTCSGLGDVPSRLLPDEVNESCRRCGERTSRFGRRD